MKGKPRNIDAYFCSHSMFKDIAQQSVKKWRHNPKIVDGKKVEQSQLLTKMAFYLEDEDGNLMYDPELFIPKGVDKRYPDGWSKTECRKSETETSDTAEETP